MIWWRERRSIVGQSYWGILRFPSGISPEICKQLFNFRVCLFTFLKHRVEYTCLFCINWISRSCEKGVAKKIGQKTEAIFEWAMQFTRQSKTLQYIFLQKKCNRYKCKTAIVPRCCELNQIQNLWLILIFEAKKET